MQLPSPLSPQNDSLKTFFYIFLKTPDLKKFLIYSRKVYSELEPYLEYYQTSSIEHFVQIATYHSTSTKFFII